MVCSHFLQSRDPKTGRMGCHFCSQARQGLEAGPHKGLTDEGSNSKQVHQDLESGTEHSVGGKPPPSGTIFCLTCLSRNPCGNTVTGETIFETKYECLKCGNFTPLTLAFRTES